MRRRHVVTAVLVLLLAAGAWVGWTLLQVKSDLADAATAAAGLQDSLEAGDQEAAQQRLAEVRDAAADARDRTDGPTFAVLGVVPVLGDDADGVATVSRVLDDLAGDGLTPLVTATEELDAGSFTPRDGRVPVQQVAELQTPLASASAAFAAAGEGLAGLRTSGYVDPLRTPVEDLRRQVDRGARVLRSAETAAAVLPSMLGADGSRRYLLLFQNNAEVRATGGLPGALAELRTEDGRLALGRQATAGSFGFRREPILPLTEAEVALFDVKLGQYFADANFTPDFPRTAELAAAWWRERFGTQVDGVLSVDPIALSYLLEATGPVEVGGRTITSANAREEILNRPYLELTPEAQDVFFAEVARTVFRAVTDGAGDPRQTLAALARGAEERRLLVHSFIATEQQRIDGTAVSGALVDETPEQPQIGVYLDDGTGSKMSYYLEYDVRVEAEWCSDGVQQFVGRMDIASVAPADAATLPPSITGGGASGTTPGEQLVTATLYAPRNGQIGELEIDGQPLEGPAPVEHEGRPAQIAVFALSPGESETLTWKVRTGPDQPGAARLDVTPPSQPGTESGRIASACG
ncbi:DUF4012 domain-containing protein [Nocardioides perillae]|uniref:DUF4012 domain-containing protein n=1 Tax=Nocardioides perillae TaxID=1119534 RepID=A0A7Y9RQQ0_9ACTN|nr:DUF4012 domain-containing protein [Nocardioides perillae]NYG54787.1 hypothetical protein [Nocardioides perillae]